MQLATVKHLKGLVAKIEQILPHLKPRAFDNGADLLGAHCEGPWLNPLKKGAHGNSPSWSMWHS